MQDAIYHNPRCSKSRQTLALLTERGIELPVIEYLKTPPTVDALREICRALGRSPAEIVRRKDMAALGLDPDAPRSDEQWLALLAEHPKLIERPIVVYRGRAAIGRPPEAVLTLFDGQD